MNIILLSFHFSESGFKIQWVDDTHALGIFSSLSTGSVTRLAAATEGPAGVPLLSHSDPVLTRWFAVCVCQVLRSG